MDRLQAYADQMPTESDFMEATRYAHEALGLFAMDVLGQSTVAFGFPIEPTTVPSLSVLLGPGRIYAKEVLEANPIGQLLGEGGLAADTDADHAILKQALWRDTATLGLGTFLAPTTTGQSQVYLIEGQFTEVDDVAVLTQFFATFTPPALPPPPTTANVSVTRRDLVAIQIKAGAPATTGSQVAPTPDAGWIPLYAITIAFGQTTITSGNIALAPGAPFPVVGSPVPVQETVFTASLVSGVLTFDWSKGNYALVPMTGAITSVVYLNEPAAGKAQTLAVEFIGNGTTQTVTGLAPSSSLAWLGNGATGTQPTFMFGSGARNKCVLVLHDGGPKADWSYAGSAA